VLWAPCVWRAGRAAAGVWLGAALGADDARARLGFKSPSYLPDRCDVPSAIPG